MNVRLPQAWLDLLQPEFEKPYFNELTEFVRNEYAQTTCFPAAKLIFNAFEQCQPKDVKVVVLGQDPYIRPEQAHGLCFSVPDGEPLPPSLRNIYKELQADLGIDPPTSGNLERWAKQGVFLLNTTLTVREGLSASHAKKGWEMFTDAVIQAVAEESSPVVFMLWGAHAIKKQVLITQPHHLILTAPHPSPLSAHRGFLGCKHFSKCNAFLLEVGRQAIEW
jgi:uracil-DNA glycosylase